MRFLAILGGAMATTAPFVVARMSPPGEAFSWPYLPGTLIGLIVASVGLEIYHAAHRARERAQ